jgi:hypothetical protein
MSKCGYASVAGRKEGDFRKGHDGKMVEGNKGAR